MKRDAISHQRRNIRLRLEILDELLSSLKRRNYTQLLTALGESLELRGEVPIKIRRLKDDIKHLEDEFGAPIHRPTKKDSNIYYTEKFSIKNIPIEDEEISLLKDAINILKKATNLKLLGEVDAIVSKLENRIHTNVPESATMIAFEQHTEALGKEYFEDLFNAIKAKSPIRLTYQPFNKEPREWVVHPYMLKEYRNRWFLIGRIDQKEYLATIRLDSIIGKIRNCKEIFIENDLFDPETYFNNVIGVTIPKGSKPELIEIHVAASSAEYIRTKPLHHSQVIKKKYKNGEITVTIEVVENYELISVLLGFGNSIVIEKPNQLRNNITSILQSSIKKYSEESK